MIALAPDIAPTTRLRQMLKILWFLGVATALPLLEFVRLSSRLTFVSALAGSSFLLVLIATQLYIMRSGPKLLVYEERFRELVVHTALKQIRVPVHTIRSVRLFDAHALNYRRGISVRGYHVGGFFAPGIGRVQVAASSVTGTGLLVDYLQRTPFFIRHRRLYISPKEPAVVKLVLEDLMAEQRWRVAFGQP